MSEPMFPTGWISNLSYVRNVSTGEVGISKIYAANGTAASCWVQLFDAASTTVTVGTTIPFMSILIPLSGIADIDFHPPLRIVNRLSMFVSTQPMGTTSATNAQVFIQPFVN